MRPMTDKWIQKALAEHKAGALHRELGVPQHEHIPTELLAEINRTTVGKTFYDNYFGKRIHVTHLLKKRANLALELRRFHEHTVHHYDYCPNCRKRTEHLKTLGIKMCKRCGHQSR